jgi:hypothetical protein
MERYDLTGITASPQPGYWGLTRITARSMAGFYAAVVDDPVVGPWLLEAMGETVPTAADGFPQLFGIPEPAEHWRVKQGWMCCLDGRSRTHSTGYADHDRYIIVLLTDADRSAYGAFGRRTLTLMANALLPNGTLP